MAASFGRLAVALLFGVLAVGTAIVAPQESARVRACASCPVPPPFDRVPGVRTPPSAAIAVPEHEEILRWDDGTCESGLGVGGVAVTSFVEFGPIIEPFTVALIEAVTSQMNTFRAQAFVWAMGPEAPGIGEFRTVEIDDFNGLGPCPSTVLETRTFPTPVFISSDEPLWAGLLNTGFVGRDTSRLGASRIWLNCAICGMTQYGPGTLSGIDLGGNWMIRLTAQILPPVPVELMGMGIE